MKVLLCKPQFINISTDINPRANISSVNIPKLHSEYESLQKIFKELGVKVFEVDQIEEAPGMIYAGDWGFVQDERFIESKFKPSARRKESKIISKIFEDMGYQVLSRLGRDYFEGSDLVQIDDNFYFGWGKRSAKKTQDYLEGVFGTQVTEFKITHNKYFHLTDCICPLTTSSALYYPQSLTMIEQAKVCFHFSNPIAVETVDAEIYACNSLKIDDKIIIDKRVTVNLESKLKGVGMEVIRVEFEEYSKLGTGIRGICLLFD